MFRKVFWVIGIASLLSACGGGSNSANLAAPGNSAPTVGNITITDQNGGNREVGDTLVGSYTYNDAEGDAEGTSTFRWLRSNTTSAKGNVQARDGFTAIPGATGKTYIVTAEDQGKTLLFEVTPVAQTGTTQGGATSVDPANDTSGGSAFINPTANAAPTATNVTISGTTHIGQTLTGSYTYADAESDAEGNSTYRWLTNGIANGETGKTYVLTGRDVGATLQFAVTPVAATGTTTGTEVISAASSMVIVPLSTVTISGKITYDRVPDKVTGLDYANITQQPVRGAKVEALSSIDLPIATTKTDDAGNYSFVNNIPKNTNVKIRVKAELSDYGTTVVDNTNSEALYVLDGSLTSSGEADATRNLNAPSGWTGSGYSSDADRKAAPFAILDSMYQSIQKVVSADSSASFDPLKVNWSVKNLPTGGDKTQGQISTSHYDGIALYILGKENSDTDEFDDHVMIHEWGHYFEAKFSRSDSMGGDHSDGDVLDMRIAFGEAWGNALSGMVTDDPLYVDTQGNQQASGGEFNLEVRPASPSNPGFYSESSLQRVLYDLYDSTNEVAEDKTSLGFTPIYNVMVNGEKNAPAFTSIFTFITALKQARPSDVSNIDSVVQMENMVAISDVYGSNQTDNRGNANVLPIYRELTLGTQAAGTGGDICVDGSLSSSFNENRLSVRRYFRFEVITAGTYKVDVDDNISSQSPIVGQVRWSVARETPFTKDVVVSRLVSGGNVAGQAVLIPGKYVMEVFLADTVPLTTDDKKHCFTVKVRQL